MSTFIVDVDGTICDAPKLEDGTFDYPNAVPILPVIEKLKQLKKDGHTIIFNTARGMRTYKGDREQIEIHIRPTLEEWMKKHEVPYDALYVGKPWGPDSIYLDNYNLSLKAFLNANPEDYHKLIKQENEI